METYQIIAGFSDLKMEFIKKTKTSKSLEKLTFWFTQENGILFMHDYEDHETCVVLAIFESQSAQWKYFIGKESFGRKLIQFITENNELSRISAKLQALYVSHGFISFSRS